MIDCSRLANIFVWLVFLSILVYRTYILQAEVVRPRSVDVMEYAMVPQGEANLQSPSGDVVRSSAWRDAIYTNSSHASKELIPFPSNLSFEERWSPYMPSSAPLSDFERKQMGRKRPTYPLRVKTPILIASLPKSGTSSAWRYFICSGHLAAHTFGKLNQTLGHRIGDCVERNIQQKRKPFDGCGHYYVWSDCGSISAMHDKEQHCYYPSIHALEEMYEAYPEMTILNMRRNATRWVKSVLKYNDMANRWQAICKNQSSMPRTNSHGELLQFYNDHATRLRQFAKRHPSITYIEMQLEGDTGHKMQETFGGPETCWRLCQPGMKFKDCKVI